MDFAALRAAVARDDAAAIRASESFDPTESELATLAAMAVQEGQLDALQGLVERHSGLGSLRSGSLPGAAWLAAATGAAEALEILLSDDPSGAELEAMGTIATTAAARAGHTDCVRVLAARAPDAMVDAGPDGNPPACAAAYAGDAEAIRILAAANRLALHVVDREGNGPAFLAASRGHADVLRAIAEAAPSAIRIPNALGLAPMEVAWNKAFEDCVALLRELGETDPAEKWSCACEPGQACGPSAAVTLAPFSLEDEALE